jgi:abortive infection bacteriophage resistance protein
MKVPYPKHFTTSKDLISLLKSRGLNILNEQEAIDCLTNIGYYRLSAYCYPLLKTPKIDHFYKSNASFDLIMNMYRFDRELRLILFDEIEKIEVAVRSAMSNLITGSLNDVFWMTNATYFYNPTIFAKSIDLIQIETDKSKEEFMTHFRSKYTDRFPPVWMIVEIIPFGLLCGIYNNLKSAKLKKKVAARFGLSSSVFSSWMITLVNLRNLCGHHSRTWNREIPVTPAEPNSPFFPWIISASTNMKRIYFRICMIKYLLFTASPHNTFTQKLNTLLVAYPTVDTKAMGFPANWRDEPLWEKP